MPLHRYNSGSRNCGEHGLLCIHRWCFGSSRIGILAWNPCRDLALACCVQIIAVHICMRCYIFWRFLKYVKVRDIESHMHSLRMSFAMPKWNYRRSPCGPQHSCRNLLCSLRASDCADEGERTWKNARHCRETHRKAHLGSPQWVFTWNWVDTVVPASSRCDA